MEQQYKMSQACNSRTSFRHYATHTHLFLSDANTCVWNYVCEHSVLPSPHTYIHADSVTEKFFTPPLCWCQQKPNAVQRHHYMETWQEVSATSALLHCLTALPQLPAFTHTAVWTAFSHRRLSWASFTHTTVWTEFTHNRLRDEQLSHCHLQT